MAEWIDTDICVIGGGSGGLSVAAGAAQIGASVVLIEGHRMGGDCLNYGCVPSKALIAAAARAEAHRGSAPYGIAADEPAVDYAAAMEHVARTIAAIAPHDSVERFEGLGVRVIQARAAFISPSEVEAGGHVVRARRFVVATGSSPLVPAIPGLDGVPYLTNETLWDLRERPGRLIVIGGGPIGLEMAQAHRRLGSEVVVVEALKALGRDDPETVAIALSRLRAEGVEIREGAKVAAVSGRAGAIRVAIERGGEIEGTHLLLAVGRRANVGDLGLDKAGVEHTGRGVTVDAGLRSVSNRRVYAIGDVAGGLQFTHVAGYQASLVVRNALFRLPVRNRTDIIPWVTYTDPELAHVGMTEAEAAKSLPKGWEVHRFDFSRNDRAVAEGRTEGLIKIVVARGGRIRGASIVGPHAGELILPWALAIGQGMKIGAMAGVVAPYPTLSEVSKRVAGAYFTPRLFGRPWIGRLIRLLARLG
ncbi:FAD-dependent oxidoreductase [Limibaculum sp. FT325]|uniref:dihydrolipoyl dehydrogenase family protein n=1 Tax=Thermohalobaculum sediminis TaxID=2939436 RepID=UPI0020BDA78A|nr:FAD-dependent oxidoreductase [Limibaculum sediminis]MCL5776935.1 FAD-dependent oxidoreductase [Limibaculum sediminis]